MPGRSKVENARDFAGRAALPAQGWPDGRYATPRKQQGAYASMNTSARMIVELNIAHFRALMSREEDTQKREMIARLLKEEESKLLKLLGRGSA